MDPLALTVAQAARLLSAAGGIAVTEDAIRRHTKAGATTTLDGRINLAHFGPIGPRRWQRTCRTAR